MRRRIARFFKTPKGILTIVLAFLLLTAGAGPQGPSIALRLGASAIAAGLLDIAILRVRNGRWTYPSGAILSAAIVVMVLRIEEPWYVSAVTSMIAIASKYVFRVRGANVFNPAALAILLSFYLFHAGESWWGAQTERNGMAKLILIVSGVFIANRVNKMPLVLTFLGSYFAMFTITAFAGNGLSVAEVFRTPDFEAALYFAFIILTDPPTSPSKYDGQIVCGIIVAAASYALFEATGVVYFLLAGVLVGNVWEAGRRNFQRRAVLESGSANAM